MEADWSVEVGAGLPTIVVPWEGFIDLRHDPSFTSSLNEAATFPVLVQPLIKLNRETSSVFTSKCDLWLLDTDEIDPLEFDAERKEVKQGVACYVDVIALNSALFASFEAHEKWVRLATDEMRLVRLPQARAEMVVRPANVDVCEGFAVTLYVAACGRTEDVAQGIFRTALETAVTITMETAVTVGE